MGDIPMIARQKARHAAGVIAQTDQEKSTPRTSQKKAAPEQPEPEAAIAPKRRSKKGSRKEPPIVDEVDLFADDVEVKRQG